MLHFRLHFLPDMPKLERLTFARLCGNILKVWWKVLYGFCWKFTWLSISERVFATMIILVGGLQSLGSFCSRAPSKNARVMLSIFLFLIILYGRDISKTADPKMAKCVVIEKSCFWFLNFFGGGRESLSLRTQLHKMRMPAKRIIYGKKKHV